MRDTRTNGAVRRSVNKNSDGKTARRLSASVSRDRPRFRRKACGGTAARRTVADSKKPRRKPRLFGGDNRTRSVLKEQVAEHELALIGRSVQCDRHRFGTQCAVPRTAEDCGRTKNPPLSGFWWTIGFILTQNCKRGETPRAFALPPHKRVELCRSRLYSP